MTGERVRTKLTDPRDDRNGYEGPSRVYQSRRTAPARAQEIPAHEGGDDCVIGVKYEDHVDCSEV